METIDKIKILVHPFYGLTAKNLASMYRGKYYSEKSKKMGPRMANYALEAWIEEIEKTAKEKGTLFIIIPTLDQNKKKFLTQLKNEKGQYDIQTTKNTVVLKYKKQLEIQKQLIEITKKALGKRAIIADAKLNYFITHQLTKDEKLNFQLKLNSLIPKEFHLKNEINIEAFGEISDICVRIVAKRMALAIGQFRRSKPNAGIRYDLCPDSKRFMVAQKRIDAAKRKAKGKRQTRRITRGKLSIRTNKRKSTTRRKLPAPRKRK